MVAEAKDGVPLVDLLHHLGVQTVLLRQSERFSAAQCVVQRRFVGEKGKISAAMTRRRANVPAPGTESGAEIHALSV